MPELKTGIQYLKGVGQHRATLYKKLGIETIGQLLYHLPRSYIDLTAPLRIGDLLSGQSGAVRVMILAKSPEQRIRGGLSVFKVKVTDGEEDMMVTFFNTKYTVDALKLQEEYILYGAVTKEGNRIQMSSPMVISTQLAGSMMPIYPAVAGLSSKSIATDIQRALSMVGEQIPDIIPQVLRQQQGLCHIYFAMENIHNPKTMEDFETAKTRLIFEELFILSAALLRSRKDKHRSPVAPMERVDMQKFWNKIPFEPTFGQQQSISQILSDLMGSTAMNRLVQGDVGSGKTIVAAAAAYFTIQNGGQVALMAPTEILAAQHAQNLTPIFADLGIEVELIVGSLSPKQKRLRRERAEQGEVGLVIGTHALLTEDTMFHNLSLVITDEQHRFGVGQRASLIAKGKELHTLVMSATPIPRTLSLIIYGDLDISVIKELPKGRLPVKTYCIDSGKRQRAYGFIKEHLNRGLQAYIVCPLVEENDTSELASASAMYQELSERDFVGYRLGLVHGKMKAKDKDAVMAQFKAGELQLLVSTTVIEVGVDVPNAVIMLVENAERFGLSQLHQLRGRVGRGTVQSHCILVSDAKSPLTLERLGVLCKTTDGFAIAEEDLRLRGPGDFFGNRQHGLPSLAIANLAKDVSILHMAQEAAAEVLTEDPQLQHRENRLLGEKVAAMLEHLASTAN